MARRPTNRKTAKALAAASCIALAGTARAEQGPFVAQARPAPVIDGVLEAAWEEVPAVESFLRYIPQPGPPPPGRTEVRFMQDAEFLYIGVRVSEAGYEPQARISPREQINEDDQIGIYIDTEGDGRAGYIFYFNPFGIQQDVRYSNGNWYSQWNAVMQSEGRLTEDGYELEIALPFRSLQYPSTETPDWKVMITRKIPDLGTKYSHPQLKRSHPRMFTQAVPLQGIKPPAAGTGLSLQPALSTSVQAEGALDASAKPSLDLNIRFTPNSKGAATLNPDFSQIEGDVVQVDLNQRFAFYYPERRPFFLDNMDLYSDGGGTLYSRSIVEPLYGLKLSGQEGRHGFAVLQAMDMSPGPSVHEFGTPGFSEEELEDAMASNLYLRYRSNIAETGLAGIYLSDKRILDQPGGGFGQKASSNTAGADLVLPFSDDWTLYWHGKGSRAGTEAESLEGLGSSVAVRRDQAQGWGGSFKTAALSDGFRGEMGYLTLTGWKRAGGELNHVSVTDRDHVKRSELAMSATQEDDGDRQASAGLSSSYRIPGLLRVFSSAGPSLVVQSGEEVRGYWVSGGTKVRVSKGFRFNVEGGKSRGIDYSLLKPADTHTLEGGAQFRPGQALWLNTSVYQQWFKTEGEDQERIARYFAKADWQLSRELGLRAIQQATEQDGELQGTSTFLLLTWLESPGTEAYVGLSWGSDGEERTPLSAIVKYTHLFQL